MSEGTLKKSRISRLKVGLATLAIGAILAVPAGAQDVLTANDDLTFTVTGGDLTTSLTADSGGAMAPESGTFTSPADYAGETISGSLVLNVSDDSGSGSGWHVDLAASNFQDDPVSPTKSISASSFYVDSAPAPTPADDTSDITGIDFLGTGSSGNDLASGVEVISAPQDSGMGSYNQTIGVSLDMPTEVYAATYTSTVTATTTASPGDLSSEI